MQNNFITQTRTSVTKVTNEYSVGSFWKSNRHYPKYYAIISADLVMLISTTSTGEHPCIQTQSRLFDEDILDDRIQEDEFSAVYEAAQLAIVDAFQTAFPQAVNLEMSER